jgi:DNA (cytosine-5)-methyltransferase 1
MNSVEEILKFRNLFGLSLEDIAMKLDINKNMIKKIEEGDSAIPEWYALAMAGMKSQLLEQKRKLAKNASGDFTFIDLFAGIGGIRTAFENAGGTCLFSSEYDPYPAKIYEDNFGEKPAGDITKIDAKDIPAHDILVGGFPCQPFSIAGVSKKGSLGRKHGFEDETQGTLFFDVARIIKYHKPKMFLLENVKNLKSHDKGNTFKIILKTLQELGYNVQDKIIDGGLLVPQHRERIYIVGTLDHKQPFEFPEIKAKDKTLEDILEPEGKVDSKYTLSDKLWAGLQRHANKHKEKGNGFGFGLKKRNERARTLSARYYKDGSEILIDQGPKKNPRRLTPQECSRLMGFPKKFKITVSDTRAYKCFGNSVVVPVVERLAKQMVKHKILSKKAAKEIEPLQLSL